MRRRDCKVDFIWFYKIPQSFFCSKKTPAPFTREPLTDRGEPCPYGTSSFATYRSQLLLFRKNHARLACSVVNALTAARCRYQLLRIADNRKGCPTQAPSDEGAGVFRRKMTEGEITKICCLLLSLPQFRYAQQLPRQREPVFYQN